MLDKEDRKAIKAGILILLLVILLSTISFTLGIWIAIHILDYFALLPQDLIGLAKE